MNWQKIAIEDLQNYSNQKESLENIKLRLSALNDKYEAFNCASTDRVPVQGGTSHTEERMIDNIVERQRLTHVYKATEKLVRLVERGLNGLDEREKQVLDLFYMNRRNGHMEVLMEQLHAEKSSIYRMKDEALYKFTSRMYGLSEY